MKNNNILILLSQLQFPTKEKRFSRFTAECGSMVAALQQHRCFSKPLLQLPSPTKLNENAGVAKKSSSKPIKPSNTSDGSDNGEADETL